MEFRRVDALPPYAFAEVERLKLELRRDGQDVIDLGFGNPDVAPPELAVEKLREAAALPRNHRYSSSRGLPKLREAICDLYRTRYGVDLDPEREATLALGAKEGLVHLLWVLLGPGDVALVPSPSYPIHLFAPGFAGAAVARVNVGPDRDFLANLEEAWLASQPRPRVLICSFPHNPTTACVDRDGMQALVDFARERGLVLVHDFAYADLAFDGYRPPSVFEAEGARDVAVELYSLTKGFSVAGWRVAFVLGRADVIAALARLKSYLDYGSFQPLQIAATVALREAGDYPIEVAEIYQGRRDALCTGLSRAGWGVPPPAATMFVWARIPEQFAAEGSHAFALRLLTEGLVAVSPGSGFGPDGEGFVRFALVENAQRIGQAVRGIRKVLAAQGLPVA
ncbi:MAG TPA: aminotransferase class I/II-fold pyridoxal phosphate-dependent enzyme [Gaiellaceae bacterium]|nr:aminotransferase class I/II-fold pyridoxal phosphate-dependent enzyme [Gaiellaceae bacterium]